MKHNDGEYTMPTQREMIDTIEDVSGESPLYASPYRYKGDRRTMSKGEKSAEETHVEIGFRIILGPKDAEKAERLARAIAAACEAEGIRG